MDRGEEDERNAILSVVAAESGAFWRKDYEAWSRCWLHAPFIRRMGWWAIGGMTYRESWDLISLRMKRRMDELPSPNRSAVEVRRENVNIRVDGNMAWMTFDQYAPTTGEPMDVPGMSRVLRVLEKHHGEWKIVCASFLHPSLDHVPRALVRVDGSGTVEWMNAMADRAIADGCGLTISSGRLRATKRPADQRLQMALRRAAELDDGIESSREVVPVLLDGGRGEPVDVCWILAEGGLIHVSINDPQLIEDRLETAAVVYGLSSSQLRLAELVVEGHGLPEAARRLGISHATVRTQLARMFDKTGARNQPALVRALLAVTSPIR